MLSASIAKASYDQMHKEDVEYDNSNDMAQVEFSDESPSDESSGSSDDSRSSGNEGRGGDTDGSED